VLAADSLENGDSARSTTDKFANNSNVLGSTAKFYPLEVELYAWADVSLPFENLGELKKSKSADFTSNIKNKFYFYINF
jgi:hypothetical protein